MSNDRKLPTFFKVTSIAPSIMRKLRDEELKKLQWKTKRNKLGEKVNDIALDDREKMEIFNARFLKQLTLSILTSDSLAAKLSGKGLNFTKVFNFRSTVFSMSANFPKLAYAICLQ